MEFLKYFLISVNMVIGLFIVLVVLFSSMGSDGIISRGGDKHMPGSVDGFKNKLIALMVFLFIANVVTIGVLNSDRPSAELASSDFSEEE